MKTLGLGLGYGATAALCVDGEIIAANPEYHDLISEVRNLTGVGALLNTSFNLHGLPIVMGAEDALHVFENSEIDAILLGDVMVSRELL